MYYVVQLIHFLFQSCKVGDAAYSSHWYMSNRSTKFCARMVIMRSHKPVVLTAGKLLAVDRPLFAFVCFQLHSLNILNISLILDFAQHHVVFYAFENVKDRISFQIFQLLAQYLDSRPYNNNVHICTTNIFITLHTNTILILFHQILQCYTSTFVFVYFFFF